jgi:TPP-dependent pyruvate/acetoin dehydrogenase alpha subunit
LPAFRDQLLASGQFAEAELEEIEESIGQQLDEAVASASVAEVPEPEEALRGVYADTHGGLVW